MKRKEIRDTLRDVPINEILLVGKSELTHKQREFARQVALGSTGAAAYRKAYDTKAKPKTQGDHASRLKADDRIKAEIEAYQLAIEAAKYRSSAGLRDLVIHSLTQVLIDPETNPAQRIQAAKVLGTVTEVGAFTERKEVTHVNGSDAIKATIMDQLKAFMLKGSGDVTDVQADDLLAELVNSADGAPHAMPDADDPTHPPPPAVDDETPPSQLHTIRHTESNQETIPPSEAHVSQDPPLPLVSEDPPGGI